MSRPRPTSAQGYGRVTQPVVSDPDSRYRAELSGDEWRSRLQALQPGRVTYAGGVAQPLPARQRPLSAEPSRVAPRPLSAPRSGRRPSSAKQRPGSARADEKNISGDDLEVKKKTKPMTFHSDPEAYEVQYVLSNVLDSMYEEIQKLKKMVHSLSDERTQLRSRIIRFDGEITKKEKQMEQLLVSKAAVESGGGKFEAMHKETHLLKNLKGKIASLEKTIQTKDEEIQRLKSDSKYTRVAELELELRTYYNESRRLQKILESHGVEQAATQSRPEVEAEIRKLQERNVQLKAQTTKFQYQKDQLEADLEHLRGENDALKRQLEELRRRATMDKSQTQSSAMQEVNELRTQLDSKSGTLEKLDAEFKQKVAAMKQQQAQLEDTLAAKKTQQTKLEEEKSRYQQLWMSEEGVSARLRQEVTDMEKKVELMKRQLEEAKQQQAAAATKIESAPKPVLSSKSSIGGTVASEVKPVPVETKPSAVQSKAPVTSSAPSSARNSARSSITEPTPVPPIKVPAVSTPKSETPLTPKKTTPRTGSVTTPRSPAATTSTRPAPVSTTASSPAVTVSQPSPKILSTMEIPPSNKKSSSVLSGDSAFSGPPLSLTTDLSERDLDISSHGLSMSGDDSEFIRSLRKPRGAQSHGLDTDTELRQSDAQLSANDLSDDISLDHFDDDDLAMSGASSHDLRL